MVTHRLPYLAEAKDRQQRFVDTPLLLRANATDEFAKPA